MKHFYIIVPAYRPPVQYLDEVCNQCDLAECADVGTCDGGCVWARETKPKKQATNMCKTS